MRRVFPSVSALSVSALCLLAACAAPNPALQPDAQVADLQRQLRARDAEIAELRRRIADRHVMDRGPGPADAPVLRDGPVRPPPPEVPEDGAPEDMARALERALVRQGGSVLPERAIEIEPELFYVHSETGAGLRRDTFGSALSVRFGLPWDAQADMRVPYIIRDRQSGGGTASGLGDIDLGLTKILFLEREMTPELLLSARWRTRTGKEKGNPPTGLGADALQAGLTGVKRLDPLVAYGGLFYTHYRGSDGVDPGDDIGGRLGAALAVTPDTSVFWGVHVNSSAAMRIDGQRLAGTNRLSGIAELGGATVLGHGVLLNVTAGAGFTSAAPDFFFTVSLPTRF